MNLRVNLEKLKQDYRNFKVMILFENLELIQFLKNMD